MIVTIDIRGADQVDKALALDIPAVVGPALERGIRQMQANAMRYPAPPPGSRYRRTGTLGRSWQVTGSFLVWRLGNNTEYAPYVQDRDRQAWMHKDRWTTVQDIADEAAPRIQADVNDTIQKAMGQ